MISDPVAGISFIFLNFLFCLWNIFAYSCHFYFPELSVFQNCMHLTMKTPHRMGIKTLDNWFYNHLNCDENMDVW